MKKILLILSLILILIAGGITTAYYSSVNFKGFVDDVIYKCSVVKKSDYDQLTNEFNDYKKSSERQTDELNEKLSAAEQSNDNLKKTNDDLLLQNNDLENKNSELLNSNSGLENDKSQLEEENKKLKTEVNIPSNSLKICTGLSTVAVFLKNNKLYLLNRNNSFYPIAVSLIYSSLPDNFKINTVKFLTGNFILINDNMIVDYKTTSVKNDFNNSKNVQVVGNYICYVDQVKTTGVLAITITEFCVMNSNGSILRSYSKNSISVPSTYFSGTITYTNNISTSNEIVANFKDKPYSIVFNTQTSTFTKLTNS